MAQELRAAFRRLRAAACSLYPDRRASLGRVGVEVHTGRARNEVVPGHVLSVKTPNPRHRAAWSAWTMHPRDERAGLRSAIPRDTLVDSRRCYPAQGVRMPLRTAVAFDRSEQTAGELRAKAFGKTTGLNIPIGADEPKRSISLRTAQ